MMEPGLWVTGQQLGRVMGWVTGSAVLSAVNSKHLFTMAAYIQF